jgi:hypothetical protein
MSTIGLNEIQKIAEHESARHHHYYIGVEHLFIAMTKLTNGLANAVLEFCRLEPRFVRYSIRQMIGVSEDRRYWSGFRITPRTQDILARVRRYAGIHNPSERDLLIAILDEGDSIPVRVLQEMDADIELIRRTAANWSNRYRAATPTVPIVSEITLSEDEKAVLRRMFRTYKQVTVQRELRGGFTGARLLVVQPHQAHRVEVSVVVKIDLRNAILHEKRHYDAYVKDTLPPTTARLIDNPALPEDSMLGGLKYTLIQPSGSTDPVDLREQAPKMSGIELANVVQNNIHDVYARSWWSQRQRYRFGMWREYEHILPAAIELVFTPDTTSEDASQTLEPLGSWSRQNVLSKGELVELRGFTVQKIRYEKGTIQLTSGYGPEAVNRSSKVELTGLGSYIQQYRPGEVVESIMGRVIRNRDMTLREQVAALSPDFDIRGATLTGPDAFGALPNPIQHVNQILHRRLSGYLSMIHGDLHLGNVLVGPAGDAWLIDFGLTREGHVLFDWATLEVSILATVIAPHLDDQWESVWNAIQLLDMVNNSQSTHKLDAIYVEHLEAIRAVRDVVQENMTRSHLWSEYYLALSLMALRGLSWKTTSSIAVRRLLFLVAALSVRAAETAESSIMSSGTEPTRDTLGGSQISQLTNLDGSDDNPR